MDSEKGSHRRFESLDELQEVQAARCVSRKSDPLCLRQHTLFHWWPTSRPEEQDGVGESRWLSSHRPAHLVDVRIERHSHGQDEQEDASEQDGRDDPEPLDEDSCEY